MHSPTLVIPSRVRERNAAKHDFSLWKHALQNGRPLPSLPAEPLPETLDRDAAVRVQDFLMPFLRAIKLGNDLTLIPIGGHIGPFCSREEVLLLTMLAPCSAMQHTMRMEVQLPMVIEQQTAVTRQALLQNRETLCMSDLPDRSGRRLRPLAYLAHPHIIAHLAHSHMPGHRTLVSGRRERHPV